MLPELHVLLMGSCHSWTYVSLFLIGIACSDLLEVQFSSTAGAPSICQPLSIAQHYRYKDEYDLVPLLELLKIQ